LILTIEPLLLAINALPKSLLIPTETRILRLFGYVIMVKKKSSVVLKKKLDVTQEKKLLVQANP